MPLEGQHGIVAHHAAAVVGDLDEFLSACFHADLDARGAGIERVLQHLLDHGSRPLHHLAGGDLVGNGFGENVDAAHEAGVSCRFSVLSFQFPVLSFADGTWDGKEMGERKAELSAGQ